MNNFQPWLSGLASILHGVSSPQQAQKDPGFLSRYMGATGNPLTNPTPTQNQQGILQAAAEALHGNPQPGSLASGIASLMNKSPMGPSQGFSGSSTAPVPSTGFTGGPTPQEQPAENPLMVRGIRPQPQAPVSLPQQTVTAPQGAPGPQASMVPMPPQRPSDAELMASIQQPRTDAPDPHGPIGSTPTIWGANYHGPENSLFNRMASSGNSGNGPGDGLKAFVNNDAMKNFAGAAGPNLTSLLNLFG